jgi:hypothetical protein
MKTNPLRRVSNISNKKPRYDLSNKQNNLMISIFSEIFRLEYDISVTK